MPSEEDVNMALFAIDKNNDAKINFEEWSEFVQMFLAEMQTNNTRSKLSFL